MKPTIRFQPENPAHGDINSYSVDRVLVSPKGLGPAEIRSLARDVVRGIAGACEEAGAKDVSHVKVFIEHPSGFLHADAVSGNDETSVGGRDGRREKRFRLVLNAVIFGLSPEEIRKAAEQVLESVEVQYGLERKQDWNKKH